MTKEELDKKIREEGNSKEFESFGLKCRIIRIEGLGSLCGYVGVEKGNILYGKDYSYGWDENKLSPIEKAINDIRVHGGLTFADTLDHDGLWYFGFDCAHSGDVMPRHPFNLGMTGETYKDMEYVTGEVVSLAKQVSEIIDTYQPSFPH